MTVPYFFLYAVIFLVAYFCFGALVTWFIWLRSGRPLVKESDYGNVTMAVVYWPLSIALYVVFKIIK